MEGNIMAFTGNVANVVLPSPKDLPTIGGLYSAVLGSVTPMPPTSITTLDTDLKHLGFVAEDGLEENEDRPTTKIFAWGADIVANPQESYSLSATFTLYEFLNPEVAKVAYGEDNVTVTPADVSHGTRLSILQTSDAFDMRVWAWDTFSPGGKRIQKFFPLGQLTNKESQTWNHKSVLAHKLQVEFFPDSNGRYSYTLTDDGVVDAS
jgi:hypothetical protein